MKRILKSSLSLLLALCLVIGVVAPTKVFGLEAEGGDITEEQPPQSGSQETGPEDDTTNEEPVSPVTVQIKRETEGWAQEAEYTISLTGNVEQVASVSFIDGDNEQVLMADADGNYTATVLGNGTYKIAVQDLESQTFYTDFQEKMVDRDGPHIFPQDPIPSEGWQQERIYGFDVMDNGIGVATMSVRATDGEEIEMIREVDGTYRFTATANMVYTVTATDHLGNQTIVEVTENWIDRDAPVISTPVRDQSGWSLQAGYTFTVMEQGSSSGLVNVMLSTQDGEPVPLASVGEGVYQFYVNANATYTITAVDAVGNIATMLVTESQIDTEKPEISWPIRDADGWRPNATYIFTANDRFTDVSSVTVTLNGQAIPVGALTEYAYRFEAKENGTYVITVIDALGNCAVIEMVESFIDHTPPTISGIQTQKEWAADNNKVSMSIKDNAAIKTIIITDANGKEYEYSQDGDRYTVVAEDNGVYTVHVIDYAGNSAKTTFVVDRVDTIAPSRPVLEATGSDGWIVKDVDLFAASNDTQSGIAAYWYTTKNVPFDKESWKQMNLIDGIGILNLPDDQNEVYYVIAEDDVGHLSEVAQIKIRIDKTPIEDLSVNYDTTEGSGFYREVAGRLLFVDKLTFVATATDDGSGVAAIEYRVVGVTGTDTGWVRKSMDGKEFIEQFSGPDDIYTVYARVYDGAGNCSVEVVTEGCILENTKIEDADRIPSPDLQMEAGMQLYGGEWTKDDVQLLISGSAAISGIEYYEVKVDHADPAIADIDWMRLPMEDGKAQLLVTADTNAVYWFRAVSYAGNISLETSGVVRVQKTAPEAATLTKDTATGTNGWHTVLPEYQVHLPIQNEYFAPVEYVIRSYCDGVMVGEVIYDGTNAPVIDRDGRWSFTITAQDAAGNVSVVADSTVGALVDTMTPDKLEVTLDGDTILALSPEEITDWDGVNVTDSTFHSDFTIFKNDSVTIMAAADGGDSGIFAIYYQIVPATEDYNRENGWLLLEGEGLRLAPNGKYHLYFKAVDEAGNVTYFSAKSLLLDDKAPDGTLTATNQGLSEYGFYNGDVTVNVQITDPFMGENQAFSGLRDIQYRILRDGVVTQEGQLWPGFGTAMENQSRVFAWEGKIVVQAALNNSNDVTVEVIATDIAGNTMKHSSAPGDIKIDATLPDIFGSYDRNDTIPTIFDMGCFTGSRTLTITVTELNFVPELSFVRVVDGDTGREAIYSWVSDGLTHTVVIPVTEDGHYAVTASVTDAAGNVTEQIVFAEDTVAADAFIIDNTPSKITTSYSNDSARNEMYFAALRTLTVTVEERNFNPDMIKAVIDFEAEDGTHSVTELSDWYSKGNIHTATITLDKDGTYRLEVSGQDALGNQADATKYRGAAPRHWVLDTYMEAPVFGQVSHEDAYNGQFAPEFSVFDANIEAIDVKLVQTRMNEGNVDVTDILLADKLVFQDVQGGKKAVLDIFPAEQKLDGGYLLSVSCIDKAGNTASGEIFFYVNRFGSVYVYDDYLTSIVAGYYREIQEDIIITEINPSGMVDGSATVQITVDGVPVTAPRYTMTAVEGESGWFEYRYVIAKENFTKDGAYSVVVSSKDTAGNVPENTKEDLAIRFAVDTTAPELPAINGMEETIVKADSVEVKLSAMDNVMLESITVYLDGKVLERWEGIDSYSADRSFKIPAGLEHTVRIVVVDKTGNVLDTDAEGFAPGYSFNRTITVSTNFFLRLYANKTAFYVTVGSVAVALLGVTTALIVLLTKKRKSKNGPAET